MSVRNTRALIIEERHSQNWLQIGVNTTYDAFPAQVVEEAFVLLRGKKQRADISHPPLGRVAAHDDDETKGLCGILGEMRAITDQHGLRSVHPVRNSAHKWIWRHAPVGAKRCGCGSLTPVNDLFPNAYTFPTPHSINFHPELPKQ